MLHELHNAILILRARSSTKLFNLDKIFRFNFLGGVTGNLVHFFRGGWLLGGFPFSRGVSDPPGRYVSSARIANTSLEGTRGYGRKCCVTCVT